MSATAPTKTLKERMRRFYEAVFNDLGPDELNELSEFIQAVEIQDTKRKEWADKLKWAMDYEATITGKSVLDEKWTDAAWNAIAQVISELEGKVGET
jgi:hypothetical protein